MRERTVSWGDIALIVFVSGGVLVPYLIGYCIYGGVRSFIRRFIKRMPNWADF